MPMTPAGSETVQGYTGAALARALGVSKQAVAQWKAAGCPVSYRAGQPRYSLPEVFAWRTARAQESAAPLDFKVERVRKMKAEADRVEIEVARERGLLVPLTLFESTIAAEHDAMRAALLSLPSRSAWLMVQRMGCSIADAQALLATIADETLMELRGQDSEAGPED